MPVVAAAQSFVPSGNRPSLRTVPTGPSLTAGTNVTNDAIWTIWNAGIQSTASVTADNTDVVWTMWNRAISATTTTGAIQIGNANTAGTLRIANNQTVTGITANEITIWTNWIRADNLTREQQQHVLRRNEEANQRRIEMEAEQARARDRAELLLQESLDAKQKAELAQKGYFELDVISRNGERRKYRIHRQWSHSIHQVDPESGRKLKTLCIHPREAVPVADSMLAQKLMLESGMEEELLRIANHS